MTYSRAALSLEKIKEYARDWSFVEDSDDQYTPMDFFDSESFPLAGINIELPLFAVILYPTVLPEVHQTQKQLSSNSCISDFVGIRHASPSIFVAES